MVWQIEYDMIRERRAEAALEVGAYRLAKTLRCAESRSPLGRRIVAWLPETTPTKEVEPERA
ncbi:MAG: hypothetical protein M3494_06125 [Actinomycetota bacterium]|jgi:hypothetical protein|nr:hypothetical protein [Actinomycetota bacterium]